MAKFFSLTIYEFINHYKVTFYQQEYVQIFPLPSPSITCALPFDFALDRDPKNIFYYHRDVENYTDQVLIFFYLIDMNIFTQRIFRSVVLVSILMLWVYLTFSLIDRIGSYFQKVAFRRNLFLIGF